MNRDSLITKEKRKSICSGKGYRQKDHETPTGGATYENSVADDLELFHEDIQLGRRPVSIAWTYFSPELTLNEMELVENKDDEYMRSFKMLNPYWQHFGVFTQRHSWKQNPKINFRHL